MTSASVQDFSQLFTFVGTSAGNQMKANTSQMNFGDVMAKADADTKTQVEISSPKQSDTLKTDASRDLNKPRKVELKDKSQVKEAKVTEDDVHSEDLSPEEVDALNEAASEVISNIATELDVTEDEVLSAIDELGLSPVSVLNADNISDIVTTLSGESDPIALITNEELFNTVTDLTTMVDATVADLAEDMDIEISDVVSMVEQAEVQLSNTPEMQMSVNADSDLTADTVKEPEGFRVSITSQRENITVKTDDKGNVIKTESVEVKEEDFKPEEEKDMPKHESNAKGEHQDFFGQNNQLLDSLANKTEVSSITETPEVPFFSSETQNIMDQIMDNIHINLKPEMDELEMQLHPASLGNVKINIANKAGEITAEFKVSNETVKEAVESQIIELNKALKDSGIKVSAVEVSVDTSGFDENLWQGGEDSGSRNDEPERRRPRRINLNDLDALFADEATDEEKLAASMMEVNGNTVDYQA